MHDHTLPGPWIILHMMKWLASAESFSPIEEKALCVRISSKSARPRCFVTPAGTIVKCIFFLFIFFQSRAERGRLILLATFKHFLKFV